MDLSSRADVTQYVEQIVPSTLQKFDDSLLQFASIFELLLTTVPLVCLCVFLFLMKQVGPLHKDTAISV